RIIRINDPKLEELQTRSAFFPDLPHEVVKAQKLSWLLYGQDLGLVDRTTETFFRLCDGPT
ncbi:MAG: hypothetical protein RR729_00660, partial [Comamonas sp.]